jgi:glycosyltransferase involved in cell wall biosynthesis
MARLSIGPDPEATPSFAYLIRMVPQTSETFIAGEILRLERLGLPLRVYSCRLPVERVEHESVRSIQSPIEYLPDPLWKAMPRILALLLSFGRQDPKALGRALAYVIRRSWRDRGFEMWKRLGQAACLAKQLQARRIRHVHAHFAHSATDVTLLASILSGVPFSFTGHARDIYTAKPTDLREKVEAASFSVTCTAANQHFLANIAGESLSDKIRLGYHGVDTIKFAYRAREPDGLPLVLSVGRLVEKKGFPDLIEALAVLKERGVAFNALIVGEGPERQDLEAQVRRLGLDNRVELPGAVSQEALVEIYKEATVFALPCRILDDGDRDGLPNVLLEAMATGLPVVSTPVSGIPEVIRNGENGLLVGERDVTALAAALELLLSDAELRQRLGKNARGTVEAEMSADAMVRQLAGLFFDAIGLTPVAEGASGDAALAGGTAS